MTDSILSIDDIRGPAHLLTAADVDQAAKCLHVSENHIHAVMRVESAGSGFVNGRPIILYESHIFSRLTRHAYDASHPLISYPAWGQRPYPKTQGARYEQLAAAMTLDRTAALKSCSWGLFQILGLNYSQAGFDTVSSMVTAMTVSEGRHLLAFVRFVMASAKMTRALLDSDWLTFAKLYNGPGAAPAYAAKLAAAFTSHTQTGQA